MLRDEEVTGKNGHLAMHLPSDNSPATFDANERAYLDLRDGVYATLRRHYPKYRPEWENLYNEAWEQVLKYQTAGKEIRNLQAFVTTITMRRARDMVRDLHSEPVVNATFTGIFDEMDLEADTEVRLTADALHQVIETLDPRERVLVKMRFGLRMPGAEIQRRTGLTAKRLEKIFASAYKTIARAVELEDGGTTLWSRRQRSLLLACELGIATEAQRARARDLLRRDPHCRALLSEMRQAMREVAVALPMPPVALELDGRRGPIGSVLDSAEQALASVRHPAADLVAQRAGCTVTEQATGTLAGGLGVTGAVKIVAACLAVGGTAAVCVDVVAPLHPPPTKSAKKPRPKSLKPAQPRVAPTPVPVVVRSNPQPVTGRRVRQTKAQLVAKAKARAIAQRTTAPVSSPRYETPATPAPAHATEFGPGATGSDPVAPQPAAAPKDGGGEFGP